VGLDGVSGEVRVAGVWGEAGLVRGSGVVRAAGASGEVGFDVVSDEVEAAAAFLAERSSRASSSR